MEYFWAKKSYLRSSMEYLGARKLYLISSMEYNDYTMEYDDYSISLKKIYDVV